MAVDSINYQLRPNKNVQRKLFIEMFRRLDRRLSIGDYRYIGLGGLWFADFSLVHRELGLTDLVSIESKQPKRANFNRPFECVRVEAGETTVVLPKLRLGDHKAIVWLDYDSDLRGPALEDIQTLTSEAASSSICIVTVQAGIWQVDGQRGANGDDLSRLEALRLYAGDLLPDGLADEDITTSSFPSIVSRTLLNSFEHGMRAAGSNRAFQLLLNMHYSDGAPMVTVGGLIRDADHGPIEFSEEDPLPFWPPTPEPYRIRVPLLTAREKVALDQMVPGSDAPSPCQVDERLGFRLSKEKLDAYHVFYRQYPMFAEYEV